MFSKSKPYNPKESRQRPHGITNQIMTDLDVPDFVDSVASWAFIDAMQRLTSSTT
jgi:hypothetical protein